jgi:hypothetical protein
VTVEQILTRDAELRSLPMGPERWKGSIRLDKIKSETPEYRSGSQKLSFGAWLVTLKAASKETAVKWESQKARSGYYEGQPDAWISYYDAGDSATEAVASDMECWEE